MHATVNSIEAIQAMLRRGLAPLTEDPNALVALGFVRAYPQIRTGYESTIWERAIDLPVAADGRRRMARQRAYLVSQDGHS